MTGTTPPTTPATTVTLDRKHLEVLLTLVGLSRPDSYGYAVQLALKLATALSAQPEEVSVS